MEYCVTIVKYKLNKIVFIFKHIKTIIIIMKFILLNRYIKRYIISYQSGKNIDKMTNRDWIRVDYIENIVFTSENKQELFKYVIDIGKLKTAKHIYSLGGIDIHRNNDSAFRWASRKGHESIVRWLHSLGGVDIYANNDEAFRFACYNGHESIVRWLREISNTELNSN